MGLLAQIAISLAIAAATFVGSYKYLPLDWLENGSVEPRLGSTITTISGSDTLSSSRTTINNNFANLNTDKLEISTWYASTSMTQLVKVGTLTTGTWNATTIGVPYGGTGSTTLSFGQVLIGNSAGNIGVVSGYGTSGQFLTSNGTGAAPTWQSSAIDQTQAYLWSGNHNFTANTYIKTLLASSTIQISNGGTGISLVFPTSNSIGAFVNNGSGTVGFTNPPRYTGASNTNFGTANAYASTTIANIPASFMTASSTIEVIGDDNCSHTSGALSCTFYLRTGTGVTLASYSHGTGSSGNNNADATFRFKVIMDNSVAAQLSTASAFGVDNSGVFVSSSYSTDFTSSVNMANAFSLVLVAQGPDAATTPTVYHYNVVVTQ